MGNAVHLPHPITSKFISRKSAYDNKVRIGTAEMQGFRLQMEDAMDLKVSDSSGPHPHLSFFAVFDGHGGDKASLFASQRLYPLLWGSPDPRKPSAIIEAVKRVDQEFLQRKNERREGSTAVFALIEPLSEEEQKKNNQKGCFRIVVGNLGDSRALLVRSNGRFLPLTKDHKPENLLERQRIEACGGTVSYNRVDGDLAVSRALGDYLFKSSSAHSADEQKVIAVPEVTVAIAHPGDSLLLCCDGLFERLTSKQVAGFVYRETTPDKARDFLDPADIVTRLIDLSLRCGSGDNMSAILVCFMNDEASAGAAAAVAGAAPVAAAGVKPKPSGGSGEDVDSSSPPPTLLADPSSPLFARIATLGEVHSDAGFPEADRKHTRLSVISRPEPEPEPDEDGKLPDRKGDAAPVAAAAAGEAAGGGEGAPSAPPSARFLAPPSSSPAMDPPDTPPSRPRLSLGGAMDVPPVGTPRSGEVTITPRSSVGGATPRAEGGDIPHEVVRPAAAGPWAQLPATEYLPGPVPVKPGSVFNKAYKADMSRSKQRLL